MSDKNTEVLGIYPSYASLESGVDGSSASSIISHSWRLPSKALSPCLTTVSSSASKMRTAIRLA